MPSDRQIKSIFRRRNLTFRRRNFFFRQRKKNSSSRWHWHKSIKLLNNKDINSAMVWAQTLTFSHNLFLQELQTIICSAIFQQQQQPGSIRTQLRHYHHHQFMSPASTEIKIFLSTFCCSFFPPLCNSTGSLQSNKSSLTRQFRVH